MTTIEGFSKYLIYENGDIFSKYLNSNLKPYITPKGYQRVALSNDECKSKHLFVHRLVAIAYIPNPENKKEIDHIDQNKLNNNKDNLRWASRSENIQNIKQPLVTNKLGIKYISIKIDKNRYKYYTFVKKIDGIRHEKTFKTLEEAIEYRDNYLQNNNI